MAILYDVVCSPCYRGKFESVLNPSKSKDYDIDSHPLGKGAPLDGDNSIPFSGGHWSSAQRASEFMGGKVTDYAGFALFTENGKWYIKMNSLLNTKTFLKDSLNSAKDTIPRRFREDIIKALEKQYDIKIEPGVRDVKN